MPYSSLRRKIIGGSLIGLGSIAAVLGALSPRLWPQSDIIVATTATYAGDIYYYGTGDGVATEGTPLTADEAATYAHSRYLVTAPGLFDLLDHAPEITLSVLPVPGPAAGPDDGGGEQMTVVVGRQVDVLGWLGDLPYTEVTGLRTWEHLATTPVNEANADEYLPLAGNDMWLAEFPETGVTLVLHPDELPDDPTLVLLAQSRYTDTPPTLTLTWPREVTAPYQWPLVGAGLATVLLGAAILLSRSRQYAESAYPDVAAPEAVAPEWSAEVLPPVAVTPVTTSSEAAEPVVEPISVPVPVASVAAEPVVMHDDDDTFWDQPAEVAPVVAVPVDEVPATEVPAVPAEPLPEEWTTLKPTANIWTSMPVLSTVVHDDEAALPEETAFDVETTSGDDEESHVVREIIIEPVAEPEPASEPAPEPESVIELERELETETAPQSAPEPEPIAEAEPVIEPVAETESASEPVSELEPEPASEPESVPEPAATGATPAAPFTPPVSRSAMREAKRIAEETGDREMLDTLTGVIQSVPLPEPEAITSMIPVSANNWRATWGLENTSRRSRRSSNLDDDQTDSTEGDSQQSDDQNNTEGDSW